MYNTKLHVFTFFMIIHTMMSQSIELKFLENNMRHFESEKIGYAYARFQVEKAAQRKKEVDTAAANLNSQLKGLDVQTLDANQVYKSNSYTLSYKLGVFIYACIAGNSSPNQISSEIGKTHKDELFSLLMVLYRTGDRDTKNNIYQLVQKSLETDSKGKATSPLGAVLRQKRGFFATSEKRGTLRDAKEFLNENAQSHRFGAIQ